MDKNWQKLAYHCTRPFQTKLMAIDDLHDREHLAELAVLLDQNWQHQTSDYYGKIGLNILALMGSKYALLRDEFHFWREKSLHNKQIRQIGQIGQSEPTQTIQPIRILVNLGGVDKDNFTLAVLKSLQSLNPIFISSISVTVVMGKTAPHIATIQQFANQANFPCQVIVNAENMAELMAQSDWAIGASGSTTWERCCLGLPSILLVLADNQREIAQKLANENVAFYVELDEISTKIPKILTETTPEIWQQLSQQSAKICDGLGAMRVVQEIEQFGQSVQSSIQTIRPVNADDCKRLFEWRNHWEIRRFMLNQDELIWENHIAWFAKQLANPNYKMLIYQENDVPLGLVNFQLQPQAKSQTDVWEWGFYLAPDCPRGVGHGAKMGRLALEYAFNVLNAREIFGQVLAYNTASLKLHEKLGFQQLPNSNNGNDEKAENNINNISNINNVLYYSYSLSQNPTRSSK